MAFDLLDNVCKHNDKLGFLRDVSVRFLLVRPDYPALIGPAFNQGPWLDRLG